MMMHAGETVYGSELETDNMGLSSDRVQGMATTVYKEFEKMIVRYDEDVVKELLPLVVTILENLDQAMTDYTESSVEIELLKDDKEQLKTQFERERYLRRQAEQRLIESEDTIELVNRDLRRKTEDLEGTNRQLEMRCKNHADQVERLQEREAEMKKEYNELHRRHNEMIQAYVEHIEKTNIQLQQSAPESAPTAKTQKRERPKVLEAISPLTPSTPQSPFTISNKQLTPQTPNSHLRGLTSTPDFNRSHASIKDEMPKTPVAGAASIKGKEQNMEDIPESSEQVASNKNATSSEESSKAPSKDKTSTPVSKPVKNGDSHTPLRDPSPNHPMPTPPSDPEKPPEERTASENQDMVKSSMPDVALDAPQKIRNSSIQVKEEYEPTQQDGNPHEFVPNTEKNSTSNGVKPEIPSKNENSEESSIKTEESPLILGGEGVNHDAGDWLSNEVQGILELGPDYSPDVSDHINSAGDMLHGKVPKSLENSGIENEAFQHSVNVNENSLFAEMSKQDLGDVDEGADLHGMGKEVENLIHENTKLLATKNALNVVKDDLIHQVDGLTTQLTMLQEEYEKTQKAKESLYERVSELESELSSMRKKLSGMENNAQNNVVKSTEEDDSLPMSQRKRFTRVEMARVLMERNQYKERLMELQEAVRWTEMLRASRDHPELNPRKNKNKSSIFQFFSRLFSGNSANNNGPGSSTSPNRTSPSVPRRRSGTVATDMNISYNVPSSKVMPKSRSGNISLYGRSPTVETVQDTGLLKKEAKKGSEGSMVNDPGRTQACGWSLPGTTSVPQEKARTVPVPAYCIPIIDSEITTKLWCAAAVNISVGKTRDGGSIVGTGSVFYSQSNARYQNGSTLRSSSQNSIEKLDEELENQKREMEKEASRREALSSLVWLVSSDVRSGHSTAAKTKVRVVDARNPGRVLESFSVGSGDANILCITSVPGVQEEDYSNAEEVEVNSPSKMDFKSAGSSPNVGASGLNPPPPSLSSPNEEEVATEVTEETKHSSDDLSSVAVMEHVFTDPLGVKAESPKSPSIEIPKSADPVGRHQNVESVNEGNVAMGSPMYGTLEAVRSPVSLEDLQMSAGELSQSDLTTSQTEMGFTKVDAAPNDGRLTSLQPTMWLGSQSGCVYVHSAMSNWSRCLHQIRLKDSVLDIVHIRGRALAALADGTVAIFRRNNEGFWDLSNYHLLDLGRPHHSIRSMAVVYEKVWCGYRNKIRVIDPKCMKIETTFDAHPRHESQIRGLAWAGDGVWVSIRLDSTLRLYHARTLQHLQDVDVEPYVSKVLGTGKLGFSFVRITSLIASNNRLWIGTGNGVVISVPLSESSKSAVGSRITSSASSSAISSNHAPGGVVRVYSDPVSEKVTPGTYIPYCSMANAQLSFHGHREAVKFFVAVPGCVSQATGNVDSEQKNPCPSAFSIAAHGANASSLVMSGGEGYIDFRHCDGGTSPSQETPLQARSNPNLAGIGTGTQNRSHIIVWQLTPPKMA